MEKGSDDILSRWREEGSHAIPQNFEELSSLTEQAKKLVQRGKYAAAAVYAEMAAHYASGKHSGLFVSPEIEQILLTIGRKAISTTIYPSKKSLPKTPRNILHVSTAVMGIGGHSRMLWHWIRQDTQHSHSVVLLRQGSIEIPKNLEEAVTNRKGKISILDEKEDLISKARHLREIAATADLIVLHIFTYDVIPMIAFADPEKSPPVIFLDHADHIFWLGAGISDVVVNLRESGMRLAQERRGIDPDRNMLLPIILQPAQRQILREEAKQQLGLPKDCVLLLSIARAWKYRAIDGISFADAHVPLLQQHENAFLLVIGPGQSEDWSEAIQKTQGRIRSLDETENTAVFFQAADVYVDTFPFVSITSLLEAGSYGVPLVSRYPFSNTSAIFGADAPGLCGNLIRTRNDVEYTTVLSRLVEDKEYRLALGEATKRKIVETHMGSQWHQKLQEIYTRATALPKVTVTSESKDYVFVGEPDVFVTRIHNLGDNLLDGLIRSYMAMMPPVERLHLWLRFVEKNGWRNHVTLLLPKWLSSNYWNLKMGWKNILQTIKNVSRKDKRPSLS